MLKVWFLVIAINGVVVEKSAVPMTAENCALQAAYAIVGIEQYLASGKPVPEKYGGAETQPGDITVSCQKS